MNPFRSWLDRRASSRVDQQRELGTRLAALVDGLQDRMDPQSYRFAAEWAGNAEWELAIETLWEESDRGAVRLSEAEGKELAELSTHPSVNQLMLRSNGANQARTRDIRRR